MIAEPPKSKRSNLGEVAILFLRLGLTAFGGPAAHIAIMEDEVVRRRRWISEEKFLDLLGAVNLIPGPNSTEMAIYLGYLPPARWDCFWPASASSFRPWSWSWASPGRTASTAACRRSRVCSMASSRW